MGVVRCAERRGLLRNPIDGNRVKTMAFVPGKERGSVLSVLWHSGHVLFYHLYYFPV